MLWRVFFPFLLIAERRFVRWSSPESLNLVCLQESEERSRLAVSQSGHGSRVMLEPDNELVHSTQLRSPALQVLEGFVTLLCPNCVSQVCVSFVGCYAIAIHSHLGSVGTESDSVAIEEHTMHLGLFW